MQAATGLIQLPFRNELPPLIPPQLHIHIDRMEEDQQVDEHCDNLLSTLEPWCLGLVIVVIVIVMYFVFKL